MVKLLIIADDFTGALDTGVQFGSNGAATYVMVDSQIDYTKIASNIEVLVIDTETRHLDKKEAYEIVFSIVQEASKMGIPYIYKKTDSALRGNVGAELTAALLASGERRIHFIPGFPQMGRTTVGGIHYVDGVPIAESIFGKDPCEPVCYSDVVEIISSQSESKVHIIGRSISEGCTSEEGILVYDSSCNEDLENISAELMKKNEMHLIAGCAGFAGMLPKLLNLGGERPKVPKTEASMLIACGSVNPVSVSQCDDAESKGALRFRLTPEQKLNPGFARGCDADELIQQIYEACEKNPIVILDTNDGSDSESTAIFAQEKGITPVEMRSSIVSTMGSILERLVDKGLKSTIFLMGGDSLIGFVHQAGIKVISPVCEIECGVVLSQLEYNGKTLNVISKSGGFGQKTMFSDMYKMLSN